MSTTLEQAPKEETFVFANGILHAVQKIADVKNLTLEEAVEWAVSAGLAMAEESEDGGRIIVRKGSKDKVLVIGQ